MGSVVLIVPGRLETATGGYAYDRRMVGELRDRGWAVTVHQIGDSFPDPTPAALSTAARIVGGIADEATVLVDGLAFGAMPHILEPEAARLRLVALVHHPLAEETGIGDEAAAWFRASERRALRAARRVIVTSRATAESLSRYGVGADRIDVVEPGTDLAPLAIGSQGRIRRLLCVATIIPRKRHDLLVRALASISERDWHLTCVGSLERHPPTADRLRLQLREAGLEDHVSLVGEVDASTLADLYHRTDLFVLASEHEGYGMVVAEALARGLPVVATRTGALPDLLTSPGRAGLLVPPGDVEALATTLRTLLSDSTALARLAEGARRRRDRLRGWAVAADEMAEVLRRVAIDGRLQR